MPILDRYFDKANLTSKDEQAIRLILESPLYERVLDEDDAQRVAQRRELARQLSEVDAKHQPGIEQAVAVHHEKIRKLTVAEEALKVAKEEKAEAARQLHAADSARAGEEWDLRKALQASCDPRLEDFYMHLSNAENLVRGLYSSREVISRNWLTREKNIEYVSNLKEIETCREVLKAAMADVEAMTLLPLTRAEVAERLTGWTHKVEPLITPFGVPYPLLGEKGDVTTDRPKRKVADLKMENAIMDEPDVPRGLPSGKIPLKMPKPR